MENAEIFVFCIQRYKTKILVIKIGLNKWDNFIRE